MWYYRGEKKGKSFFLISMVSGKPNSFNFFFGSIVLFTVGMMTGSKAHPPFKLLKTTYMRVSF